jgi:hypothetical protein
MWALWPACKEHAVSLDDARMAMYMHITNDTAWTTDYSEGDLIDFVEHLR